MTYAVFLPGTLCDERLWHNQLHLFPDYTIVNLRVQDSEEAMLEAIAAVPANEFILIGFSMGGHLAFEFTLKYPERVKKLFVIGSSCEAYPPEEKALAALARDAIKKGLFKGVTDRRLRDFLAPSSYDKKELRELIHSMSGENAAQVYLNQLNATLERRDLSNEVGKIKCPLTVIGGKEDKVVSKESILRVKDHNPNAVVHIIEDCGHFVPLEKPEELNAILSSF